MRCVTSMPWATTPSAPTRCIKHIPFTITQRSDISYGLFYDNLSSCWLDLGGERDRQLPHRLSPLAGGSRRHRLLPVYR
ncbi:hypothetical protein LNO89_07480 [Klebsiella pneumoniae subsp. pneumoniae]|nr:hypothetical protein [Klebsiella pneumoniae subsp. pneumoniae]